MEPNIMQVPMRIIYRGILKNIKLYASVNRDLMRIAIKDGIGSE
jgi:hypothetical protein